MATSASWMMPAPFMATPVISPRCSRSMSTGLKPTLMGWAPMPRSTGRPCFRAWTQAAATSRKAAPARIRGRRSTNSRKLPPGRQGLPKSWQLTLECRSDKL